MAAPDKLFFHYCTKDSGKLSGNVADDRVRLTNHIQLDGWTHFLALAVLQPGCPYLFKFIAKHSAL